MRVKKTKKAPRPGRPARSPRSKKVAVAAVAAAPASFAWVTTSRAIVSVLIFVVVAAALLNAGGDVSRVDVEREHVSLETMPVDNDTPRPVEATKTVVAQAKTVVEKAATTTKPEAMTASVVPAIEPPPVAAVSAASVAPTTITGCLERDDEGTFRLTDTSGAEAPTARSWKSGFLKKRAAHIELADAVGTLNLQSHIGRRVAADGTLVDRELRARSVRLVGPCESPKEIQR
jgi:hypothetical protein